MRIGARFARMFLCDVDRFVEQARVANHLDPSWSVTYAADDGKDVSIRFDREPETLDWQMLAVRVNKTTGKITVLAQTALRKRANVA
jgi:hypothetical protein